MRARQMATFQISLAMGPSGRPTPACGTRFWAARPPPNIGEHRGGIRREPHLSRIKGLPLFPDLL